MKKFLCLLSVFTMLCCGSCSEKKNEDSKQESSVVEYIADYETNSTYTSFSAFQVSAFAKKLKENGAEIYMLEYDKSRYNLSEITADGSFYKYVLHDNVNEQSVRITITYDTTMTDIGALQSTFYNDKSYLTTAENNKGIYDVYMLATPYVDYENFGLLYVPFQNYRVSIYAGDNSTANEILEYFDDFELVEAQEE